MMESMASIAPSVGSTTAMGFEDDANNFSMVQTGLDIHDEDCFNTRTNLSRQVRDISSGQIERFETALEEQRQKEMQEDNSSIHTLPVLETCWGIEIHGRDVYTHNIFVAFQREVVAARDRRHVKTVERVGDVLTTSIGDLSGRIRVVRYNSSTKAAQCTCRMFESLGIMCSHIIVVLKNDGCNEIPSQYVLHRWTKMASRHLSYDANGHELEGSSTSLSPTIKKLYSETCSLFSSALHTAKHCEDNMKYFHKVIGDALAHLRQTVPFDEQSKVQEFESFIGTTFPSIIKIHPPEVANTKGSGKRLKRGSEEAMNKRKRASSIQKGPRSVDCSSHQHNQPMGADIIHFALNHE